jgi:acetolactate synthase-1/2/3 large subunit
MAAQPAPQRAQQQERPPIAADAFLRALADHGVDYFFANPGTDFPPVVEAFSRAAHTNAKVPRAVVVPHENLAVAMAHGVYLMNGRPQAVMVHVNVGTANTINNIINMSRDRAPLLLAAGRTPITERGTFGGRTRYIHWAQEMFDQAGMLREVVKWDYELRMPGQVGDVVSRAYEVSMTSPRGPVYMVLPREPLAAALPEPPAPLQPRSAPAAPQPDRQALALLADWIAAAERPLIITARQDPDGVAALAKLTETWAIPLVAQNPRTVCLPSSHPMHFGYDSAALVQEADLILCIDADVPWIPQLHNPPEGCRVAHLGEDPAYVRIPMRSFPSDLSVTARAADAVAALDGLLASKRDAADTRVSARRTRLAERMKALKAQLARDEQPHPDKITKPYLSKVLGEVVGPEAVIFNEYWLMQEHCLREQPGTFFALSPAGGLGWALGAALGAKMAEPDKLIVATVGDGAYMFTNPTVSHWVADKFKAPVLTVICNNSRYGAVRGATLSMFKQGVAGENDGRTLADLDPSPPFEEFVKAQGGHGERVERAADLPGALARARDAVVKERKQALVNVICPY